jgi:hypothetical protein
VIVGVFGEAGTSEGTLAERFRHARGTVSARLARMLGLWTTTREADARATASPRPGLSRSVFTLEGCSRWCRDRASRVPQGCQGVEKGAEF